MSKQPKSSRPVTSSRCDLSADFGGLWGLSCQGPPRGQPSARKAMTLLNGVFKRAKREGWIAGNPVEDVDAVRVKRSGDFAVLTIEEVYAVMRAARSEQAATLYAVAAFAGLRMGELRALRWRDVDFANRTLFVRRSYTHYEKRFP